MNSYEELAVSQPVTKMKVEVEKHIGQASAQHTPARSRALEQKEEIFSKEIKGIIQRLEEQERLNAAEGAAAGVSSPSLASSKSGSSGIAREKRLGDQISFTDVSFLCTEMPKGAPLSFPSFVLFFLSLRFRSFYFIVLFSILCLKTKTKTNIINLLISWVQGRCCRWSRRGTAASCSNRYQSPI